MLWPIARVLGADPRGLQVLSEIGLTPTDLIERERRVPCRPVLAGLQRAVELFDDPLLGLRAGVLADEGLFDVLEHAARAKENLGEAMEIFARYSAIFNEGADTWLEPDGELTRFCYASKILHPPAANDFVITASLAFAARTSEVYLPPREIWVMHDEPAYAAAYTEYFLAPVRFGAPINCIVIAPGVLQTPMKMRNRELAPLFELKLQEIMKNLAPVGSASRGVRTALAAQLREGALEMGDTARRVGMSVATLRRKLEEEGTSWSAIVDDIRREAACRQLTHAEPSVTEIALHLGFSDVRAFGRAFKRWTGVSPTEYRDQKRGT